MNASTFDALSYVDTLQKAGVPEIQAKAQARVLSDALQAKDLVIKQYLDGRMTELELRLIKWMVGTGLAVIGILFALLRLMG